MPAQQSRHSPQGEPSPSGVPLVRTHRPGCPPPRGGSLIDLFSRLSARDVTLAYLLDEHRTLTTNQIVAILYRSTRTCTNRLIQLRELDFVRRFRPVRAGVGQPPHWIAGKLAHRYVTLARDQRPLTSRALEHRQDAIMVSPQLEHLVGVNGFFADLIAYSREHPGTRLARWWSELTTTAALGRRIHPDGHGVWREDGREIGFYLEHDTGTEDHARLVAKLEAYRRLRRDGGPDYPVLFWLPGWRRERHLQRRLADTARDGLQVATAARDTVDGHGPAGPVWWLAGNGAERLRLADIPSGHGQPGPYTPGPPSPEDDPLHLLTQQHN